MQKSIKKSLRKKFPRIPEDELEKRAWAIARDRFKKIQQGENMKTENDDNEEEQKLDELGRVIVAENVPLIFNANICSENDEDEE